MTTTRDAVRRWGFSSWNLALHFGEPGIWTLKEPNTAVEMVLASDYDSVRARLTEAENLLRECTEELDFEVTNNELLFAGIDIFLDGATPQPGEERFTPSKRGLLINSCDGQILVTGNKDLRIDINIEVSGTGVMSLHEITLDSPTSQTSEGRPK